MVVFFCPLFCHYRTCFFLSVVTNKHRPINVLPACDEQTGWRTDVHVCHASYIMRLVKSYQLSVRDDRLFLKM